MYVILQYVYQYLNARNILCDVNDNVVVFTHKWTVYGYVNTVLRVCMCCCVLYLHQPWNFYESKTEGG
jgi:hypothetical protein